MDSEKGPFAKNGFCVLSKAVDAGTVDALVNEFSSGRSGERRFSLAGELAPLVNNGALREIAHGFASAAVRPTRVILFDKSSVQNWSLGWHQDRTIAVSNKVEMDDYEIWSKKSGVWHVEPPFEIIQKTISLRLSVDPSDGRNGGLEVIPGSHKLGRLSYQETEKLAQNAQGELIETAIGDVTVLSTAIVHRSKPSDSGGRRRVVHVDYSFAKLPPPLEWAYSI